jgi:hypothetical protein
VHQHQHGVGDGIHFRSDATHHPNHAVSNQTTLQPVLKRKASMITAQKGAEIVGTFCCQQTGSPEPRRCTARSTHCPVYKVPQAY